MPSHADRSTANCCGLWWLGFPQGQDKEAAERRCTRRQDHEGSVGAWHGGDALACACGGRGGTGHCPVTHPIPR